MTERQILEWFFAMCLEAEAKCGSHFTDFVRWDREKDKNLAWYYAELADRIWVWFGE